MNFFFDARYIRTDFHDGISRYAAELGTAISAIMPVTFLINNKAQLKFLPLGAQHILIHAPTSAKEPFTALILNRYKPDVVFSPLQTIGSAGRKFKLILTSHDMIYYRHRTPPHNLNPAIRGGWWLYHQTYLPQRIALNAADRVVTVSEDTKRGFEQAKLTKRPIIIVPPAPRDLGIFLKHQPTSETTPSNLIYMGSFMPYKNVETLILGMKSLPNHTLHLLSGITPERQKQLETLTPKGAKIIFHNGVSDQQYAELLAQNAILVTASLDEGYGLPVAEALALGVPAVVSDINIFHEVAGDGALFFSAKSQKGFAQQIKKLDDKATRQNLVKKGKKHISRFTWESSAQTLADIVKSLV